MEWLIAGPHPGGYTAPTRDWVSLVLIGMDKAKVTPYKGNGWWEDSVFFQMTVGLGHNNNVGGLALADKGMNGRKEVFFGGRTPNPSTLGNNLATRLNQRNHAAVFSYMRNTIIWDKFKTSSQHMENVLNDFDVNFNWNGQNPENTGQLGRPTRAAGEPVAGLRDLYCYWIDKHLTDIERKAAAWLVTAEANYRASSYATDNDGIAWLKNVMTPGGLISAQNMRFLHSTQAQHTFNPGNPNPTEWLLSNFDGLWSNLGAAGPF